MLRVRTFRPILFTGEEPLAVPFSPLKHTNITHKLCALLFIGLTLPMSAMAEDTPPNAGSAQPVHTSWADSVRSALAHRTQRLKDDATWTQQGIASWYGRQFHGRRTSSGEIFNTNALTAAHRTLPIGTKLKVMSEETGRSVIVTVNDRGPFNSRVIDLSHAAASQLGMLNSGTAHVKIARVTDTKTDDAPIEVADAGPTTPEPTHHTTHQHIMTQHANVRRPQKAAHVRH
ncbi:septal ring lytic transglycosylase RlpA family protein [Neokomagataea thailandica]|uniref:septal ring lytic transglycosylase RlpA family protein n=1 Tax=Neokomagataea thailandica TaxID=661190 RepID=UPI000A027392